jgi:hypothetical protein
MAASIWTAIVLLLLFALPGAALGPILLPGAASPLGRAGRAAGISLLAGTAVCTALARLGLLTAPALLASIVAISVGAFAIHPPRIRRPSARSRRWWAGSAAAIVLAAVLVVLPSRASIDSDLLPLSSTTWYYANLAERMASVGGIPDGLAEWGSTRPFQTDYLPVTAHTAGMLLVLPGDLLTDLEIYRLAILAIGLLFGVLLLRRWVSSWAALLGAILLFSTVHLEQKFVGYRPETVAFDLLLFTVWLADRAIVERTRRIVALAIVSGALVLLAHAEVFLILVAALAGIGVARAAVVPDTLRPGWLGLRLNIGRSGLRALGLTFVLVLGSIGLGSIIAVAATGQAGVFGYFGAFGGAPPAAIAPPDQSEMPAGWTLSGDPTWDFYVAAVAPDSVGTPPPASFRDSRILPRTVLRIWTGLDGRTQLGFAALIVLVAAPAIAWRWLDSRRRRALVVWLVFGLAVVLGSFALFAISDTYVPQRTGGSRLMPYLLFLPVTAATVLLWAAGRRWRLLVPRPGARIAFAALAVAAVWAVSVALPLSGRQPALSPAGYEAFLWMRQNLPPDARLLANGYTDGSIAAVTDRVGIVDGRAAYLESPRFRAEATALCLAARVFFATPSAAGARSFLTRERVTHVIVSTAGPLGVDIGGYPLFSTDAGGLAASPLLRLTRSFGDGRLLLYEVVGQ